MVAEQQLVDVRNKLAEKVEQVDAIMGQGETPQSEVVDV